LTANIKQTRQEERFKFSAFFWTTFSASVNRIHVFFPQSFAGFCSKVFLLKLWKTVVT